MLNGRFQYDMLAVASSLKEDLASALTETSEIFSKECKTLAAQYAQGSKPRDAEVYQAALLFLKGQLGGDVGYLYGLVSFGLYMPIEAADNQCIAANHKKLEELLNLYREHARNGVLWEMTWFGVLMAYFEPATQFGEQEILLRFLQETYPRMMAMSTFTLPWMKSLQDNPGLLTRDPCRAFAERWLAGDEAPLRQVAGNLHIPEQSWFWHELLRAGLKFATDAPDEGFKPLIPRLLVLIAEKPGFLDEDLSAILHRYNQCANKKVHEELRDFALRHWKNPKLRYAEGSKWIQLQEPAWRMVIDWVNEAHSRVFFEMLSARYGAGEERLSAWLRYIAWVKLVSGYKADVLKQKEPELTRLFKVEEAALDGAHAAQDENLEDFMALIGAHLEGA